MRRLALLVLVVALAAGAVLRFHDLAAREMSDDEGASWAAASAPTLGEVVARQARLNPGKLALHEIILHEWIAWFGDGLAAIRVLSAILGTISILLVFWIALELLTPPPEIAAAPGGYDPDARLLAAALGALVFAVNVVVIKYSRKARMYALTLTAILAQVGCFVRASRRGGLPSCAGAALFMIAAIAANFTAALVPLTEGIWLACLLVRSGFGLRAAESRRAWALAAALFAGGVIFLPLLGPAFEAGTAAAERGAIGWIKPPAWWEPFALFNKATGSVAFPALAAAAILGAIAGWRREHDAAAFLLLWMWAPPVLMMVASYTLTPIFVERYALSCFAPFFILTGLGIFAIPDLRAAMGALAVVVALSLGHVHSFNAKPHDTEWREAARLAVARLEPGQTLAALPAYSVEVIRYYLPPGERSRAVRFVRGRHDSAMLVMRDHALKPAIAAEVRSAYPRIVARLRGVSVRAR